MTRLFLLLLPLLFTFGALSLTDISAQSQDFEFSANSKDSYQCFYTDGDGDLIGLQPSNVRDESGRWLCFCRVTSVGDTTLGGFVSRVLSGTVSGEAIDNAVVQGEAPDLAADGNYRCDNGERATQATLKPPKLQQLEVWFVRIVYVIWALVASLSFFFLVVLGYRYMITRGDVTKITEIRQKIIYYIVGVVIVFLAVPILSTIFRLIGINNEVQCYDVEMPGFQFFFNDLCTTPEGLVNIVDEDGNVIDQVSPRDV